MLLNSKIMMEQSKPCVNFAVITVSSTRTIADDTSGDAMQQLIEKAGYRVISRNVVPDNIADIRQVVEQNIMSHELDVVVTIGGTGLTHDDVTIQAVKPLLDKIIDGFSVLFHHISMQSVGISTLNSRAMAGTITQGNGKGKFIFALPGSTGAVKDGWKIIADSVDIDNKPCSLMSIQARVKPEKSQSTTPASLSHLPDGQVVMVDISNKKQSNRVAVASGLLNINMDAMNSYMHQTNKGNAKTTAQLAAIVAAKNTSQLIPLCHPIPLNKISVEIEPINDKQLEVKAMVSTFASTGVEMEALTAVSTACLTLYDMLKAIDKDMSIENIKLLEKSK